MWRRWSARPEECRDASRELGCDHDSTSEVGEAGECDTQVVHVDDTILGEADTAADVEPVEGLEVAEVELCETRDVAERELSSDVQTREGENTIVAHVHVGDCEIAIDSCVQEVQTVEVVSLQFQETLIGHDVGPREVSLTRFEGRVELFLGEPDSLVPSHVRGRIHFKSSNFQN